MAGRRFLALVLLVCCGCERSSRVERIEWVTMGTVAAVQTRGDAADERAEAVRIVGKTFAKIERFLNTHDPASQINELAPLEDAEVLERCDPSVSNCYAAAFALSRATGGAFNPRWRGTNTLDLGAIAKGFAVDCAAEALGTPPCDLLIDLGGNLKSVRGVWRVGIAKCDRVLEITNGMACATSAEYYRGKHIRDGRNGNVVSNELLSVTVVHPSSAMAADGLSTTLFILGAREGERFLSEYAPAAKGLWSRSSFAGEAACLAPRPLEPPHESGGGVCGDKR